MSQTQLIDDISAVLRRHGDAAMRGDEPLEAVARTWIDAGFDDAEEDEAWLLARCFTADGALMLERAGITAEQASILTNAGTTNDEDTIGHKLTHGNLSPDEAGRIITSRFWNT